LITFIPIQLVEGFDALADLIASYTLITRRTHFVFVPGPLDLTVNSVLPRKPLLSSLTARLRSKIPNGRVHMASNPCRLKFFAQEIVVFRDDVMSRMLRNLVGVKPNARNEDLKRYVRSPTLLFFFHQSRN
jgi:DNA polymerase epsilon subunit 2